MGLDEWLRDEGELCLEERVEEGRLLLLVVGRDDWLDDRLLGEWWSDERSDECEVRNEEGLDDLEESLDLSEVLELLEVGWEVCLEEDDGLDEWEVLDDSGLDVLLEDGRYESRDERDDLREVGLDDDRSDDLGEERPDDRLLLVLPESLLLLSVERPLP